MTRLRILGTGNAQAVECYNTCLAIENENGTMIVDAGGGNGILKILERENIELNALLIQSSSIIKELEEKINLLKEEIKKDLLERRKKLGFLEKKQDYKVRAEDYHNKEQKYSRKLSK